MVKKDSYEYIRAFAIFAVIIIHCTYMCILQFRDSASYNELIWFRVLMNMMLWAVPCFFMNTGALLLSKEKNISIKKLYKKYVFRMLVVLLIFGSFFSFVEEMVNANMTFSLKLILKAFYDVLVGESWAHMWYLYCLLGIYLLLPLWKIFSDNASDEVLKYSLGIMFIFNSCITLIKLLGVQIAFYNHIESIYPFWILMGGVYKRGLLDKIRKYSKYILMISSLVIIIFTVANCMWGTDEIQSIVMRYDSPIVIIQAVGIYLFVSDLKFENIIRDIVLNIADKSFGIYLVHMVFVNALYKFIKFNPFSYTLSGFVLLAVLFVVFILSYFASFVMKKIPFLNKLL